jgi:hypothetical protein
MVKVRNMAKKAISILCLRLTLHPSYAPSGSVEKRNLFPQRSLTILFILF